MEYHKKGCKTTEGIFGLIYLVLMIAEHFYLTDLAKWSIGLTIVLSAYLISRSFYKAHRDALWSRKESEIVAIFAVSMLQGMAAAENKLSLDLLSILLSINLAAYMLSRGHAKSLQNSGEVNITNLG